MQKKSIEAILSGLRRRRRFLNAALGMARGLFYGAATALLASISLAITDAALIAGRGWLLVSIVPAGSVLGLMIGLLRPIDSLCLARTLDRAADSEDRFASAVQLAGHHRQNRVELVVDNALSQVRNTELSRALPLHVPDEMKWFPVVAAVLALVLWLSPGTNAPAAVSDTPEVTAEQWQQLKDELLQTSNKFKDPKLDEEKKIYEQLKQLASSLSKQPDKKKVLAGIAKMRSKLQSRRRNLKTRDLNMKKASTALRSSKMLKKLAALLKKGDYKKAARELKALAKLLRLSKLNPTADELESVAKDFERLARQLQSHDELHRLCKKCESSARSLNQQELADALKRLSKSLDENSEDLKKSDALCKACSGLDDLEQMLSRMKSKNRCPVCQGKNSGNCSACSGSGRARGSSRFVRRGGGKNGNRRNGGGKGGLKAGTGSARNWKGGSLAKHETQRLPDLIDPQERNGTLTTVSKTVSTDERADSGLAYKQKFTELVQKAEADLALEDIPFAYRDFLRRYFNSIKPQEQTPDKPSKEREEGSTKK